MGFCLSLVGAARLPLIAAAVLLVGCGGGGGGADSTSSGGGAGVQKVTIEDYSYKPAHVTVDKGATVSFTNQDSTPHTATSKESGLFESGSIDTGKTASITLDKAGTFTYYCAFHPFMKGTITVE